MAATLPDPSQQRDDEPSAPVAGNSSTRAVSCLICRSRKVRCDRSVPDCQNCVRLGVPCPGYGRNNEYIPRQELLRSADDIFKAAGVEKRKVGSCEECRSSKHRCTKTRPSCRRCILRKLPCVYPVHTPASKKKTANSEDVESPIGTQSTPKKSQSHAETPNTLPKLPAALGKNINALYSHTLPKDVTLQRRLICAFFDRSSSLRILSFIHRPSFWQSFDRDSVAQDYGEPLLYIMCAAGARHIYFDHQASQNALQMVSETVEIPGAKWADRARQEVLREIHAPTVQHLMTMLILCDYGLRQDRNAMVFIMISCAYRVIRLLSLDQQKSLDITATAADFQRRESEIRLVWACYFVDALVGTGVEKNLCWRNESPDIPLPGPEQNFIMQTPSVDYFVNQMENLDTLALTVPVLDWQAISLLIIRLRTRVMITIRESQPIIPVWEDGSPFKTILAELSIIYNNLPPQYWMTDANIHTLKSQNVLGGVFTLHLLMHAIVFDLTRVSISGFTFPITPHFKLGPESFQSDCRRQCRMHAEKASQLIREVMNHGRTALDDTFCADAALESAKIQIVCSATSGDGPQALSTLRANVSSNIEFIYALDRTVNTKNHIMRALLPICNIFGLSDIAERYKDLIRDLGDTIEVTGSADMHHLSRLAAFRRGRSEVQGTNPSSGTKTSSSSKSFPSPLIQASNQLQTLASGATETYPLMQNMGLIQSNTGFGDNSMHQPLLLMPVGGGVEQNRAMLQPSINDYIRAADEYSRLLTYNIPELPDWTSSWDAMLPG